jgi:hypothetical protein
MVIKQLDGTINVQAILESLGPTHFITKLVYKWKIFSGFSLWRNCLDDLHLNDIPNANYKDYIKVEVTLAKNIK